MKSILLILFCNPAFAQINGSDSVLQNNLYTEPNPMARYTNEDSMIQYWENGKLAFLNTKSINGKKNNLFLRFYPSGRPSMCFSNFDLVQNIVIQDSFETYSWNTKGDMETYYENGNIRTIYSTDSLGMIVNDYRIYDTNGRIIEIYSFEKGALYNGFSIIINELGEYDIVEYNFGELVNNFILTRNREFFLLKDGKRTVPFFAKRKWKKMFSKYYLGEHYRLLTPF